MKKKKNVPFEEFKAGRKTYLVFPRGLEIQSIDHTAAKRFHCKVMHLRHHYPAYVVGDDLYLEDPKIKGQKKVLVIEYIR